MRTENAARHRVPVAHAGAEHENRHPEQPLGKIGIAENARQRPWIDTQKSEIHFGIGADQSSEPNPPVEKGDEQIPSRQAFAEHVRAGHHIASFRNDQTGPHTLDFPCRSKEPAAPFFDRYGDNGRQRATNHRDRRPVARGKTCRRFRPSDRGKSSQQDGDPKKRAVPSPSSGSPASARGGIHEATLTDGSPDDNAAPDGEFGKSEPVGSAPDAAKGLPDLTRDQSLPNLTRRANCANCSAGRARSAGRLRGHRAGRLLFDGGPGRSGT